MSLFHRITNVGPLGLGLALASSAVLGAGVTAAVRSPDHAAAAPVPVSRSSVPARTSVPPRTASRPAAPVNQTVRATFVAATQDSVTVQGVGTIQGTPDVVVLALQVAVTRSTADDALDAASTVVRKLVASLHDHGVAARDVQSTGLFLNPQYDYHENQPPTLTGYQAGQSLTARLRSASKRGATIGAAVGVSSGDVQISGLSFDLEDNAALLDGAQRAAYAAAHKKAALYAKLSGRRLARVLTVSESSAPVAPPQPYLGSSAGMAAAAPVDVPLEAGTQGVSVVVTVTWALR